ncbi:hypothetical protein D9M68_874520 [compost metagenome]
MSFKLYQYGVMIRPSGNDASKRRQQEVVDLRAVGRWRLLQQLPGQCRVQMGNHTRSMPDLLTTRWIHTRKICHNSL